MPEVHSRHPEIPASQSGITAVNRKNASLRLAYSSSPFVRLSILIYTYPHAIACEGFLANPEVLKNSQFIAYWSSTSDPMPQYMIDILHAAARQNTYRTMRCLLTLQAYQKTAAGRQKE
ncbi:MAG TPA: hypothetical protein DCF33_08395 [Saprospirales bacterium]|nr:hypothetical protein [Saprospirales bacterium]